jgi:hypothetical protein
MPNIFKKIFNSRKQLNEEVNPTGNLDNYFFEDFYINSWYNKPFYGKVDTRGFPVIPREQKLRFASVGSDTKQVQALDFVAELFKDVKKEYEGNYKAGNINKRSDTLKGTLQATRGFVTSRPLYLQAAKNIYSTFLDYIIGNNSYQKINDYDTFINELKLFLYSKDLYLTRAGYVESKDYSPLYTGLVLEVYNANYSDTSVKQKFYEDINYGAFLEICLRHGFILDKEIPWRIFCDIRQTIVAKKIVEMNKNSNVIFKEEDLKENLQKLFDVYYDRVLPEEEKDYDYFKEFITVIETLYKSYILQIPTYNIVTTNKCGETHVIKQNKKDINVFNNINDLYKFYLKLYFDIRRIEIRDNINNETFDYLTSICLSRFEQQADINFKKAICDSLATFTKNISTLPYREKSLIQGGPIKGPA